MRIVSWNIRAGGGKRAGSILGQLLEWNPDVIGLCEFRGTAASQWLAGQLAGHVWGRDSDTPERREALSDHAAHILDLD